MKTIRSYKNGYRVVLSKKKNNKFQKGVNGKIQAEVSKEKT